jgi:hypothetical protein
MMYKVGVLASVASFVLTLSLGKSPGQHTDSRILVEFVGMARLVAEQPVGGAPVGPQHGKQDLYNCFLLYYAASAAVQGWCASVVRCGKKVRGTAYRPPTMARACERKASRR